MSNRTYSSAFNDGKAAPNFNYIYDPSYVTTGVGQVPVTGAYRPYTTADVSNNNISVSGGLNITVGAVAVTGNPQVQISNVAPINVTGIILTQVTGNISSTISSVAITGSPQVTINGGFVGITGSMSGQLTLGTGDSISVNNKILPISGVTQANITNTAPIAITGFVRTITTGSISAVVDNTSLIAAVASGNAYSAAVSGLLSTNISDAAYVTGQVSLVSSTAPLAISGVVLTVVTGSVSSSITNPIGVTGTKKDANTTYSGTNTYNFLAAGGRAVAASGAGSISGYATGDFAILNIDKSNGGLFVSQGVLDPSQDAVTIIQSGSSTVNYTAPSGSPAAVGGITGMALNSNRNRINFCLQNTHASLPLYVLFGSGTPGTGNFSLILNPASEAGFAGDTLSDIYYKGRVNVSGGAWNAFEL